MPLRVIEEPELGLSNARVAGIEAAKGGVISFVDDDNIVSVDWVAKVVEDFRDHPEAGAVGGRAVAVGADEFPPWFADAAPYLAIGAQGRPGDITDSRGHLYGAGLSLRRDAVEDILAHGGLVLAGRSGETLTSGEDTELCYRLAAAGWRLRYDPELTLQHVMTPGRVHQDHIRRIVAVSGRMEVLLEPLRLATRSGWRFELQRRWWLQAARELGRLLRSRILWAVTSGRFAHQLRWWASRERLRTLFELRGDFDRAVLRQRDAPPGSGVLPRPG